MLRHSEAILPYEAHCRRGRAWAPEAIHVRPDGLSNRIGRLRQSGCRFILHEASCPHDRRHAPPLASEKRQVLQGISVYDDEIRMGAGLDHTELSLLLDNLSSVDRGGAD